ncbi:MAG: hypothetical protein JKY37_15845 [Nannocystaceae bacterium]|nr:hypothetical protein [Nannocystaceae bacterium]
MRTRALIIAPLLIGFVLPTFGCGLFRRNRNSNSASNNVEINTQGRDIATLNRDEYEIIETSIGEHKQTSFFLLTIPVGKQTSKSEGVDGAYYAAVDRIPECDVLMMPRVSVERVLIPLLLVNIVIRKTRVKGRCAHLKGEREGVVNSRGAFAAKTITGETPVEDSKVDEDVPTPSPEAGKTPEASAPSATQ